ncbi:helix-turn-helix domain-containing protein [Gracilibacillus sp. S3-1-1]|uniref:Helix-turn-helix domain-containing protein n=1 Tax=Gracilibacillus pellucidus TaxID=3095368 RepID=A0ACC6M718_9BACI|nr:helix-turn-helix domain-containing protein [Gracilibacillus sp. S3-1-1]MDX8046776.1 helix-turn-helix domain-containing protein [Gracilibacillus sp. S3-1-1]
MEQVLRHYKGYIACLCQREIIEENGDTTLIVDEEWT